MQATRWIRVRTSDLDTLSQVDRDDSRTPSRHFEGPTACSASCIEHRLIIPQATYRKKIEIHRVDVLVILRPDFAEPTPFVVKSGDDGITSSAAVPVVGEGCIMTMGCKPIAVRAHQLASCVTEQSRGYHRSLELYTVASAVVQNALAGGPYRSVGQTAAAYRTTQ